MLCMRTDFHCPLDPQRSSDNFLVVPTTQEPFIRLERRQGISQASKVVTLPVISELRWRLLSLLEFLLLEFPEAINFGLTF